MNFRKHRTSDDGSKSIEAKNIHNINVIADYPMEENKGCYFGQLAAQVIKISLITLN